MADKHTSIKVYHTKDYDKFKVLESNREIKRPLVKMLEESIEIWNLTLYKPMIVLKDFSIIDGQHRFEACKNLEEEIHYIIIDEVLSKDKVNKIMYLLNLNVEKWRLKNFCEHCRDSGLDDYATLLDFSERHGIRLAVSAALLMDVEISVGGKGEAVKAILSQTFKVKTLNKAEDIGKKLSELSEWIPKSIVQSRYFIKALRKFLQKHKEAAYKTLKDRMSSKFKGDAKFPKKVNDHEYYGQLVEIHNYRTREENIIKAD